MIDLRNLDNKKTLLLILGVLILAYLDFTFVIGMQRAALNTASKEEEDLKKAIGSFNSEFANMRQIKSRKDQAVDELLHKSKRLAAEEELPLLMQNISVLANNNSVKIMRLTPSKEAKLQDVKVPDTAANSQKPQAVLLSAELVCDYHSLGEFINDLENAKEFMEVSELKISSGGANLNLQNISLTLRAYVKK